MSKAKEQKEKAVKAVAVRKGLPLFDPKTRAKIVEEAMAPGANMTEVARKYGTSEYNVYRWVRLARRAAAPHISSDSNVRIDHKAMGQYRTAGRVPEQEVSLEEENDRLHKIVGRLTLEIDRLSKK